MEGSTKAGCFILVLIGIAVLFGGNAIGAAINGTGMEGLFAIIAIAAAVIAFITYKLNQDD